MELAAIFPRSRAPLSSTLTRSTCNGAKRELQVRSGASGEGLEKRSRNARVGQFEAVPRPRRSVATHAHFARFDHSLRLFQPMLATHWTHYVPAARKQRLVSGRSWRHSLAHGLADHLIPELKACPLCSALR